MRDCILSADDKHRSNVRAAARRQKAGKCHVSSKQNMIDRRRKKCLESRQTELSGVRSRRILFDMLSRPIKYNTRWGDAWYTLIRVSAILYSRGRPQQRT